MSTEYGCTGQTCAVFVLKNFPRAPLVRQNTDEYLKYVDEIYLTDAYHSLFISTPMLMEMAAWEDF